MWPFDIHSLGISMMSAHRNYAHGGHAGRRASRTRLIDIARRMRSSRTSASGWRLISPTSRPRSAPWQRNRPQARPRARLRCELHVHEYEHDAPSPCNSDAEVGHGINIQLPTSCGVDTLMLQYLKLDAFPSGFFEAAGLEDREDRS